MRAPQGFAPEAVFSITQLAARDELRSSRNGPRESASEQREGYCQRSNCPTQARLWLEWASFERRAQSHSETEWPTQGFFCLEWVSFIQLR